MTPIWKSCLSETTDSLDPVYHQKARSEILPYIDWEPRRVLDIGCGGGATGRLLQEHFPSCEVFGIERHPHAAAAAAKTYQHVVVGDIESADIDTNAIPFSAIDTVLLLDVLEHLYNPWQVLENLRAELQPQCRIIASIPNAFNIQLLEELASGQWKYDKWGLLDITHIRFFTEPGMRELFAQTGFDVVRIGNVPHPDSMLPSPIHGYDDRVESAHVIVKAVDEQAYCDLMSIQKIVVAACATADVLHEQLPENRSGRFAAPILNPSLGRHYLDLVRNCILGFVYEDPSIILAQGSTAPFSAEVRENGMDWPSVAHSMIGNKRMQNVQSLAEHVIKHGIPGDLIETGVWRGGACIMMRAVLKAYGVGDRTVWVADSFAGLPPPNPERYPADSGDTHYQYNELAVSLDQVKRNFERYGLLDGQVSFLKGWFSETLPTAPIERLALLRLDGDMYESTIDALTNLFPKLSPGGFVIVDDYGYIESCRQAVHDYRNANGVTDTIYDIDGIGVFWQNLSPNRFSPAGETNKQHVLDHQAAPFDDGTPCLVRQSVPLPDADTRHEVTPAANQDVSHEEQVRIADHRTRVAEAAKLSAAGNLADAADILIKLVTEGTQVWEAYNDLAAIALHQNEAETAEQLFKQAIERSSSAGKANLNLAWLQATNGDYETALATLSPLLRQDPGNFAALDLVREILGKLESVSPLVWARLTADLRSGPR